MNERERQRMEWLMDSLDSVIEAQERWMAACLPALEAFSKREGESDDESENAGGGRPS